MTPVRLGKIILASLLTLVSVIAVAGPSSAATWRYGTWNNSQQTSSPTIQQTNLWYYGAPFTPPANLPANAEVETIRFTWKMMDPPPANLKYTVWLCTTDGMYCTDAPTSPNRVQTFSGSTSDLAGLPAKTPLQFVLRIDAPTTYVFKPYAYHSSRFDLYVDYSYYA